MISVSARFFFIKTCTFRFPAQEKPTMEEGIVQLANRVAVRRQESSRA